MATAISNLLDPNLGLSGLIERADPSERLPRPHTLATGAAPEAGLADLFKPANFQSLIMAGLEPRVSDENLLRPDVLKRNLETGLEKLKKSRRPEVRRFVRDDLNPLMDDQDLLRGYLNLMMGG
ncbi:MAG: type III secretion protein [Candidatus Adiutrix sp.]|jgi:hypothetical protein|nr:type III secretion protein [Candidatus Adiutrix sp.]